MIEQVKESDLQNQYFIKFSIPEPSLTIDKPQMFTQINLDRVKVKQQAITSSSKETF